MPAYNTTHPDSLKKHLILGTAGHIDHGKTALVKALTGFDCDTHKEEKERGITIHLGFTHLDLTSGESIGVVDVPGHAAFIRTMVSGAAGIDFFLLVIAADSGVMPQTHEHLQILEVLGITQGIVVINKIDAVEPDVLMLVREEIEQLSQETFLKGCPIVEVSARTGAGIDLLKQEIAAQAERVQQRPRGLIFRMFIDRLFTVKGFGTVVTGSVIGGELRVEGTACLLPLGKQLRVRRCERHGRQTSVVVAGDRASLNLVGLDFSDFKRGMLVSDRQLRSTMLVDARLTLFRHSHELGVWSNAVFLLGTFEAQVRIHLIDRDRVLGGESALVQMHLPLPAVALAGDRFVIRSTSSDITLGGGEVIDAAPLHHRRRPADLVRTLGAIAGGTRAELIAVEVRKRIRPVSYALLAEILNMAEGEIAAAISAALPDDIVHFPRSAAGFLLARREAARWREAMLRAVRRQHAANPLDEQGVGLSAMLGAIGVAAEPEMVFVVERMLGALENEGILKHTSQGWIDARHAVSITPQMRRQIEFVDAALAGCGMQTPVMADILTKAGGVGLAEKELKKVLAYLVDKKRAYAIEGNYLHAAVVDTSRTRLLTELAGRPQGMTVAQFRDLIDGNRKICLLLLQRFDAEGATRRDGDVRLITEKGTQWDKTTSDAPHGEI
jgi:selenocysteine-specific elongation factor